MKTTKPDRTELERIAKIVRELIYNFDDESYCDMYVYLTGDGTLAIGDDPSRKDRHLWIDGSHQCNGYVDNLREILAENDVPEQIRGALEDPYWYAVPLGADDASREDERAVFEWAQEEYSLFVDNYDFDVAFDWDDAGKDVAKIADALEVWRDAVCK